MNEYDYPIRIEHYLPLQDRYSCILVGYMPDPAYQKTPEGQRILVLARVMHKFKILNPELLEEKDKIS